MNFLSTLSIFELPLRSFRSLFFSYRVTPQEWESFMSDIDHVNKEIARVPKPLAKVWTKHVEARTIWEKLKDNLNTFQWDIFADKVRQKGKVRV